MAEVAHDEPLRTRLAQRLDGLVEALNAARDVDHRAVLLRKGNTRQHHVRLLGGGVLAVGHHEQVIQPAQVLLRHPGLGGQILADGDDEADAAVFDAAADTGQTGACLVKDELGTVRVRVAVLADEHVIRLTHAGNDVELGDPELAGQRAGHVKLLVRAAGGDNHCGLCRGALVELLHDHVQRGIPSSGTLPGTAIRPYKRGEDTLRGVDELVVQARVIGHPATVHLIVLARGDAVDLLTAGPDVDVGTRAAVHINGRRALEEPNAHLEAEVTAGEGTHGAEIHHVHGVIAVQLLAGVAGDGVVRTATHDAEHFLADNLLHEAHAAAAEHAALLVQIHARPERQVLALLGLGLREAVGTAAVVRRVLLQLAFAGHVADGAVQRVIGEQELQHAAARLAAQLAIRADAHVLRHGVGTGDDGAGHPLDGLVAVLIISGGGTRG